MFKIINVNSPYVEIEKEVEKVFSTLPKTIPAQFNGHAIDMSFAMPLNFPNPKLDYGSSYSIQKTTIEPNLKPKKELTPVISTTLKNQLFLEHSSNLNIPFHHERYSKIERELNYVENEHSAVKPFIYKNVVRNVDLDAMKQPFLKEKETWLGRKFWNEDLATVRGDNY
jgi:hypothetical protein